MQTVFLAVIAVLLPGLLAKYRPFLTPPAWPPEINQPFYWGDELNVTKCYCEGPNADSHPGHYYQFDYLNYHNKQEYTLSWTCDSDATTRGWAMADDRRMEFPVPECWNGRDSWRKERRKECSRSYNGDTFCFELGDSVHPYDYYFFNGQKRGLPDTGIRELAPDQCAALCDKVGGKAVASECIFLTQPPMLAWVFDLEEAMLTPMTPR